MKETDYLKSNEKVLRILRDIDQFTPFSNEDIMSFLDVGKLIEYKKGEEIIQEGETEFYVYFLLSGGVTIEKDGVTIKTLRRTGELFGEMGMMNSSPLSAAVTAIQKTLVLRLDSSIIGNNPEAKELALGYTIYRLFCEILAERLRVTTEENIQLKKELKAKQKKA
nr:cyclic nucleotide-binding domain-containing protein [Desulfobulbaceae bacterium]